jgi:general stress protein 26
MDNTGALWFFTDLQSEKVDYLGLANLSFVESSRTTYISISGRAEIHTDRTRVKRLWTSFAKPWFPEGPDSSNLALLKFEPDAAEYWDSPHGKMVRMFAMAASVVAGKPIGLGEHDTLTDLFKETSGITSG